MMQLQRPMFEEGPLGPWKAYVRVRPPHPHGRPLFTVVASWFGPPQVQFPADPRPGHRDDQYATPDRELAIEVARRAVEELRHGRTSVDVGPGERVALDLRAIARDLIARDAKSPYVDPALGAAAPAP